MTNISEIQNAYNLLVGGIDKKAHDEDDEGSRAYGGSVRAAKGLLVEGMAKHLIEIAWQELGQDTARLSFGHTKVKIPINKAYLERVYPEEVAQYIQEHINDYNYGLKTDIHLYVDKKFVMGVECKAYTENAMLKRILVDFMLLRQNYPELKCVLLQLESQLTGDYSQPLKDVIYGSRSTHTLLSYFDVDLNIITLLEGERRVDKPIHKPEHFKKLTKEVLNKSIENLKYLLRDFKKRDSNDRK